MLSTNVCDETMPVANGGPKTIIERMLTYLRSEPSLANIGLFWCVCEASKD